jgi:hypothetical protein
VVLEQHSAGTLTVNKLFLEKTEDAIKNEQCRDTGNIGHKAQKKTLKIKNTTQETKK